MSEFGSGGCGNRAIPVFSGSYRGQGEFIGCLPYGSWGGMSDAVQQHKDGPFLSVSDVPPSLAFGILVAAKLRSLEYGSDEYNAVYNAAAEWRELYRQYENGEAGLIDLRNFDDSGFETWEGWSGFYNEIIESESVLNKNADIREILRRNGYSDEAIEDILSAEVNNEYFKGNNVLSNALCEIGYSNCSNWSVQSIDEEGPAIGSECVDKEQREGKYNKNGDCQFTVGGSCMKGSVPGKTDASGNCVTDDDNGDDDGDDDGDDGGNDDSCSVITQENADECGFTFDENGNLIDKDRGDEDGIAPFYTDCGGGIWASPDAECPDLEGTGGTEGDPCTVDGKEGTIQDGVCVPNVTLQDLIDEFGEAAVETAQKVYDYIEGKIEEAIDDPLGVLRDIITGGVLIDDERCYDKTARKSCDVADPEKGEVCWKDCVNIVGVLGIPGLPMPPGIGELATVRDLEDFLKGIGKSLEEFLEDPAGTVEDWIKGIIDKIKEVFDSTTDDASAIIDWLKGIFGAAVGAWVWGQIEEEITDTVFPNLMPYGPCPDGETPREGPSNEGCPAPAFECASVGKQGGTVYREEECAGCLPTHQEENGQCVEWVDGGATEDECAAQNREFVPSTGVGTDSKCGGCLSEFQPNELEECVPKIIECTGNQVYNESLGECEDPSPDCTVDGPCTDDSGAAGTFDENCDCIATWINSGPSAQDCSALGKTHIPADPNTQTPSECGDCEQDGWTPTGQSGECEAPWQDTGPTQDDCSALGKLHIAGDPDTQTPSQCGDCEQEGWTSEGIGKPCTGPDDVTDCPEGQVRRGGLTDGECVRPGVVCFSEPSKYAGDDPAINKGQFNSEGFCVAPDGPPPGQTCDNNAVNPDDCDDCGDGTTPDQHINGDCNEDLKNIDGTEGQCPADSERAGQNPLYDGRDTNKSGFFTTPSGITYTYEPCNPSLGFSIVGQDVNVCEDQNNLNYGNIVQQPEEPCGDCKPGFDKPDGYDTCTSIVDVLCKDDNVSGNYEECGGPEEPPEETNCAQQGKVTNEDGSCGGCDTEKGYVLSELTGRCYIPPEDDCADDAEGNPRVRDGFGRCVAIGSECRAESFGGQDCRDPETNAYQFGVIDADGSCVCPGDIEEPPEVNCSEITEDNYKDCNKVKCPEGSTTPYADSLDDCVAAPAPTCEENDPNSESDGQGGCKCKQNYALDNDQNSPTFGKCVGTKLPPEQCTNESGDPSGAVNYPDCNKCPEGQDFNKKGICDDIPVVTCEDPNATNYEQAGECGPCNSGFDQPAGYDVCTSITQLCADGAEGYGPDNELCGTDNGCPSGQAKFDGENCEDPCPTNPDIGVSDPLCGTVETCNDPNAVNNGEDGPCECKPGFSKDPETLLCVQGTPVCENGATVESGCDTCPDGTSVLEYEDGICPSEPPEECANGATDYPTCTVCPEGQSMDAENNCVPTVEPPPPETGGGGGGGMLGGGSFTPFLAGISYTPQAVPEPPAPAQKDYMAELDNIIKRSLFEGMA